MAARVQTESAQRISNCVTALLREQPFFGSLALRLPIRADASRETVASDGKEIRYSPQWIAEAQAHAIETAIARVVLACALKHHTRRAERDTRQASGDQLQVVKAIPPSGPSPLPDRPPGAHRRPAVAIVFRHERRRERSLAGPRADTDRPERAVIPRPFHPFQSQHRRRSA